MKVKRLIVIVSLTIIFVMGFSVGFKWVMDNPVTINKEALPKEVRVLNE